MLMSTDTNNCDTRPPQPDGSVCNTQNCLIEFDGYWWWTNYPFNISDTGYWFNGEQWDPRLAFVDAEGLHLQMQQTLLPNAPNQQWSSIEVLLWGQGTEPNGPNPPPRFYPGYGTYLVAASTAGSFGNNLANNACFGAFTYRFDQDNSQTNTHHELDMIECSRWGKPGDPTNAQFTLQPWEPSGNLHRITLQDTGLITLVMQWLGAAQPVTFSVYYGIHDLQSLPATPDITWTTSPSQNTYIPTAACQTVHLNLWRQPPDVVFPDGNQEVIIKRFQYQAGG
jgi:hypothetical protein